MFNLSVYIETRLQYNERPISITAELVNRNKKDKILEAQKRKKIAHFSY